MVRGRGKGKKTTVGHEDAGSGEEEKIPVQKRRGRPQKPLKDDIDEEEVEKIEQDDSDNKGTSLSAEDINLKAAVVNGRKRKRNSRAKEKPTPIKEENSAAMKPSPADLTKPNGLRLSGSRRKSKPRRAAEVGVKVTTFLGIGSSPYPK